MMRYERTQRALLLHWIMVPLLLVGIGSILLTGGPIWVWLLVIVYGVVFAWVVTTFSMLTVVVDGDQIRVYFGRGWPRKTIVRGQITTARVVRNPWWYGLGIRWIPKGTLWNVWGFDAVELQLASGRVFRIGTDDPEGLLAAIAL